MKRYKWFKILGVVFLFVCLFGCKESQKPIQEDTTDVMDSDSKESETIVIFQFDQHVYTLENFYEIDYYGKTLEDGGFYELTADIDYLNGGIAGYVDFPEIKRIIDCKEISPFDLNLPLCSERRYGLTYIGDYADGDFLLHEMRIMAVWKDGDFVWRYDKEKSEEDGTLICYREGVSEDEIREGIKKGILSCADYFVEPAINP